MFLINSKSSTPCDFKMKSREREREEVKNIFLFLMYLKNQQDYFKLIKRIPKAIERKLIILTLFIISRKMCSNFYIYSFLLLRKKLN